MKESPNHWTIREFPKFIHILKSETLCARVPLSPHPCDGFLFSHSNKSQLISSFDLPGESHGIIISLMISDVYSFFMYLLAIYMSLLEKYL